MIKGLKKCKECGILPKIKEVKGNIAKLYKGLRCPKCQKSSRFVTSTYGPDQDKMQCSDLIKESWNRLN